MTRKLMSNDYVVQSLVTILYLQNLLRLSDLGDLLRIRTQNGPSHEGRARGIGHALDLRQSDQGQ